MTDYGERLGVAFQLADDLHRHRLRGRRSRARRPGTDLREGVPTLPVLLALRVRRPGRRPAARAAARRPAPRRRAARRGARRCCARHDAMRQAREHTRQVGAEAAGRCWRRCRRARPRRPCSRWWRGSSTASADPASADPVELGPEHGGRRRVPAAGCRWRRCPCSDAAASIRCRCGAGIGGGSSRAAHRGSDQPRRPRGPGRHHRARHRRRGGGLPEHGALLLRLQGRPAAGGGPVDRRPAERAGDHRHHRGEPGRRARPGQRSRRCCGPRSARTGPRRAAPPGGSC